MLNVFTQLKEVNTTGAVLEMNTYAEPPSYIHYLGEAIGECTGLIPLRTENSDVGKRMTKTERWKEIRAMFNDHQVILKMIDIDPREIPP